MRNFFTCQKHPSHKAEGMPRSMWVEDKHCRKLLRGQNHTCQDDLLHAHFTQANKPITSFAQLYLQTSFVLTSWRG